MPKALFFNVPAHGHINPSLPLVTELVRRGHHITYFVTENYCARVEAAGAVFQPYTCVHDDYFEAHGLDGSRPQKAANLLMTTSEQILPELLETTRQMQPDYVLFDGMCPWGNLTARILRLPAVASLSLMPLASDPRMLLNPTMLRIILPMLLRDFGAGFEANKRSRALGKQYNVPPIGATSIMNSEGDISISYTSQYFQPNLERVSRTTYFVGWTPLKASDQALPFELENGRRLIYVSLGTIINENADFFRTCIEAFAGSDAFVVISTGRGLKPDSFGTLPDNILILDWVPQIEVLKRASLFVTHAGLNSVHDGLYFGVPLLLVPQQGEQTFTAIRVVELGAGLMLQKEQVNVESIRSSANQLLTDPHFKTEANRIGDTFRAAGGVSRAVDEIEALLRERASSTVTS
jgi:MGT family glycosyltransferase